MATTLKVLQFLKLTQPGLNCLPSIFFDHKTSTKRNFRQTRPFKTSKPQISQTNFNTSNFNTSHRLSTKKLFKEKWFQAGNSTSPFNSRNGRKTTFRHRFTRKASQNDIHSCQNGHTAPSNFEVRNAENVDGKKTDVEKLLLFIER